MNGPPLLPATICRRTRQHDRSAPRRARGIVVGLLVGLSPLFGACSGEATERRVELTTQVRALHTDSFENAWGWTVSVESAWLSIGSLQLLEGEPLGRNRPNSEPWWQGWLIKTAHAHPGHYQGGNVVAEMLEPAVVDLTRVTELTPSQALTGQPRSGQIVFGAPATVPSAPAEKPWAVQVSGHAERTDEEGNVMKRFFIAFAGDEMASTDVTGCPFQGGALRAGGVIELGVDLGVWFDQVDFTELSEGTEQEATPLAADARANNGFLRGLEKASAYLFQFHEERR